jgi:hypothetical protein
VRFALSQPGVTGIASVSEVNLLPLVIESVNHQKGRAPKSVFISYGRADVTWLREVTAILQPLEQSGLVHVWSDVDIEPGSQWDVTLRQKMARCDIAIVLVSTPFLQSEYVRTVELPFLLERARAGRTHLLWVPVSASQWQNTELRDTQAACPPEVPLAGMSPSETQIALVRLRQRIEQDVRASDGLADTGLQPTPLIDRFWFQSVYFREPGHVLFEIATDVPGFAIDEPLASLGQSLRLPPQYEKRRSEIEQVLPAVA